MSTEDWRRFAAAGGLDQFRRTPPTPAVEAGAVSDLPRCQVTLVGGPHHARTIDQDAGPPGITIVMVRGTDDGPVVHDLYRRTRETTADGLGLAVFTGTRPVPVPPEPPEDDDQVPPLDPELAPYLDWPLYFPDDSVHCDKFPDCGNRDCADPESGRVFIASGRRLTIREFLTDIKAHAERT